jgi:molybdate/tungstate transport system substrate-binding protein
MIFALVLLACTAGSMQAEPIQVAYAGSMGVVMDRQIGPDFARINNCEFQGIGRGSYGLAHMIDSGQLRPDIFLSVTRGPMDILLKSGRVREAIPVASTEMVIAYGDKSKFAAAFKRAAAGSLQWFQVLERPGFRFGRTDPRVDPQGRNIIITMLLAGIYYKDPSLASRTLGSYENPQQIFSEPSLLSRLEAGQLDAASSYRAGAVSRGLPYIRLPQEINLGNAAYESSWYSKAHFQISGPDGKPETVHAQPLVYYAAVLKDASHPELARRFLRYLGSKSGLAAFESHGYDAPRGTPLR